MAEPKWISNHDAMKICVVDSTGALRKFIARWNADNPDCLILKMYGRVDEVSLRAAMKKKAQRKTPGMAARRVANSNILKGARQ